MENLNWEMVSDDLSTTTGRLKVDGGHLYRVIIKNYNTISICFVPCCNTNVEKQQKNHDRAVPAT